MVIIELKFEKFDYLSMCNTTYVKRKYVSFVRYLSTTFDFD